jgi:hypothetical protein
MKTKNIKKIILGLALTLSGSYAKAQGLEGIIVEKYYVANAADESNSIANGAIPQLVANQSVTYRVYVDMEAGWKFSLLKGNANHPLKITTTTAFYNDPNNGVEIGAQGISAANIKKNTVMMDSYLTTGGVSAGKVGVVEGEDTDGSLGNTQGILQNNPGGVYGLPINVGTAATASTIARDGLITGTAAVPTALGFGGAGTPSDVFIDNASVGTFSTTNGALSILGGGLGFGPNNRILIGQFTTDGVFGFELNIQLINPGGTAVEFVANNPQVGETVFAGLTLAPNNPPTVSITAPLNGANVITGSAVSITANAADADGSVTSVEFFVDGLSIGIDNASPYASSYTATVGSHTITARATDNIGDFTNSSNVVIVAANNQAPTVSISAPATAAVGDVVTFTSNASDVDGTVSQVEFLVDGLPIGVDLTSPYSFTWTAIVGPHTVRAIASDNLGLTGLSTIANISVAANIPPTAAITSPVSGASYIAPAVVTIDANSTDADGTVTQVEFKVNGVSIGIDNTSPYSINWTSVIGIANITVESTDDKGAVTISPVITLNIADPFALPYAVGTVTQTCLQNTFCLPISAAVTYTVDNVIGYDLTLNYDKNKITPTGTVTVNSALINPSFVDVSNVIDAVNGIMNISVYFNATAPANTEFNGTGQILCVEFTKNGTFNATETTTIQVSSLEESYITNVSSKSVSDGTYSTLVDNSFTSILKFWSDASRIKYNTANPNAFLITNVYGSDATCVTNTLVAVQPDLDGKVVYNITNGANVSIQRDILGTTDIQSVVNGADALLGRRLLLNDNSFIPSVYQIVALDVNLDGKVSAGDVSQINQRAVLSIPEFKQAWNYSDAGVSNGQLSKDWLFIDSLTVINNPAYAISTTFPLNNGIGYSKARVPSIAFCLPVPATVTACPLIDNAVFRSVLLGDVNGNYASILPDGTIKKTATSEDKVVFDLSKATIKGNTIDVPVFAISKNPVNALDFSFKYDTANLTYNTTTNFASSIEALSHLNANDQTLRFTSNGLASFNTSKSIVSVRFEMINGTINPEDLNSVAGYLNGEKVEVEVIKRNTDSGNGLYTDKAISVYPNPSSKILNVVAVEDATVQIFDITAREVLFETKVNANETQEINVENFARGVYLFKIFNNNFVIVKKVVLSN